MALVITDVRDQEVITRNRRTKGLKQFVGHTKKNVEDDSPVDPNSVPYFDRPAIELEEKRKANHTARQI